MFYCYYQNNDLVTIYITKYIYIDVLKTHAFLMLENEKCFPQYLLVLPSNFNKNVVNNLCHISKELHS